MLRSRFVGAVVLAALCGVVAVGCGDDDEGSAAGGGGEGGGEVDMLLSYQESIVWAPLLVGREAGYFEDEGLTVSTEETEGSGFVTQQIIAGNKDFGWAAADSIVVAASKDPRIRAVTCNQAQNIFRIVVLEGSDVASVDDLAGKTLGFTEKGGGEEPLVKSALADAGITDDVKLLPIGAAGPQSKNAIENGTVDAYASSYPDISSLTAGGTAFTDITPDKFSATPGDCLVALDETLKDPAKADLAAKLGRAWTKGAIFGTENPEVGLEMSCKIVPDECEDPAFAKAFYDDTIALLQPVDSSLTLGEMDPAGWQTTADVLLETGSIESEVDVDALIGAPEVKAVQEKMLDFDAAAVEAEAKEAQPSS
ncbi:MAG TPA: ABC transporter substrate-binding protein [Solirubrobacteraceae bacterium]|nr:ABC transporter substrate-binding protein [Solirubrobacteraceae bacterium]